MVLIGVRKEVERREGSLEVDVEAEELTHATHEAVEADCLQARTQERVVV